MTAIGTTPKRSKYEIFEGILKVTRKGAKRTRIMYISNLSFYLLEKYMAVLVKRGLLEADIKLKGSYFTTEKGERFLNLFKEIKKITS